MHELNIIQPLWSGLASSEKPSFQFVSAVVQKENSGILPKFIEHLLNFTFGASQPLSAV